MGTRPVPLKRVQRLRLIGTLQAKIAAAYFFHWLRGWLQDAEKNEHDLIETHWRTALRTLDSMSYMRGAMMKIGQTLSNFPGIVPSQFVQMFDHLHCDAPPMHWSLLREMVFNDLGDEPENIFASFETNAFAAASLGQVHRARLRSGEQVAVKIQYPGIGRTIRTDFQNLLLCLLPVRLNRDWESIRMQLDDLRVRMEHETDYEREAATLDKVRSLFRPEDGIVVPRVFREYSTHRILTMEWLPGLHFDQFMAADPSQDVRNKFAMKILRASYRMLYSGRLFYADMHPGNFLFMNDGRLGVVDFGFMLEADDDLWEMLRVLLRPLTNGRQDERVAALRRWSSFVGTPAEEHQLRLTEKYVDWIWGPRTASGEYDFGDEAEFRRGVRVFAEIIRKRRVRAPAVTPTITRQQFGMRSLLYRLRAKIADRPIVEEEIQATGWDRGGDAAAIAD